MRTEKTFENFRVVEYGSGEISVEEYDFTLGGNRDSEWGWVRVESFPPLSSLEEAVEFISSLVASSTRVAVTRFNEKGNTI